MPFWKIHYRTSTGRDADFVKDLLGQIYFFLRKVGVATGRGAVVNFPKWHEQKVKIYILVTLNASFLTRSKKNLD